MARVRFSQWSDELGLRASGIAEEGEHGRELTKFYQILAAEQRNNKMQLIKLIYNCSISFSVKSLHAKILKSQFYLKSIHQIAHSDQLIQNLPASEDREDVHTSTLIMLS